MPPSSIPSLKLLLIFPCLAVVFAHRFPPSCSDEFLTLTRNMNTTKHCKKLRTLGAMFSWDYHVNGTGNFTRIQILFGAKLNGQLPGWIAWGVNPGKRPEMIGTKAVIGIMQPDRLSQSVDTYEVTVETRLGCRLLPSSLSGVQVPKESLKFEYDETSKFYSISAAFILPFQEYNISKLNHVWQVGFEAYNVTEPGQHPTTLQNVDSTETIDLTSGNGYNTGGQRSHLRAVHGVLNIIGWGTLLPIGVIIARYFRVYPFPCTKRAIFAHIVCQSTGFLIGTAGFIIGLWLGHASRYYTFHTHRTFAIFIFTFTIVQMLALRLRPRETDDYRKYWNIYHHILGYSLLAVIVINIFKGICMLKGGPAWRWAYIAILGLLGAVALGFEIYTWIRFIKTKLEAEDSVKKSQQS